MSDKFWKSAAIDDMLSTYSRDGGREEVWWRAMYTMMVIEWQTTI